MSELLIKMLTPKQHANEKKVRSIPLDTVLIPLLTLSNALGITDIDKASLGYSIRIAHDKAGNPKFNANGQLKYEVAKPIRDNARTIHENWIDSLKVEVSQGYLANREAYDNERKAQLTASIPTQNADKIELAKIQALVTATTDTKPETVEPVKPAKQTVKAGK
jgi:hypothetical protein